MRIAMEMATAEAGATNMNDDNNNDDNNNNTGGTTANENNNAKPAPSSQQQQKENSNMKKNTKDNKNNRNDNKKIKNSRSNNKKGRKSEKQIDEEYEAAYIPPSFLNLTHFLSHIPKSGAEYAHGELVRLLVSTIPLPNNLTINKVRMVQSEYNKAMILSDNNNNNSNNNKEEPLFFSQNLTQDAYMPPVICNMGNGSAKRFKPYYLNMANNLKFRCSMWMSEQHWTYHAQNVYTIVREPASHLLSQYFHCTESMNHAHKKTRKNEKAEAKTTGNDTFMNRQDLMPSLDVWLDAYANLTDRIPLFHTRPHNFNRHWYEGKKLNRLYACYNPVDSESAFVKFPPAGDGKDGFGVALPEDYTYPYPYNSSNNDNDDNDDANRRDEATKILDKTLFEDLKRRYNVIGDTARMTKTVCAIFVDYTQGKHIPKPCDCTNIKNTITDINNSTNSSGTLFEVPNLYVGPNMKGRHFYSSSMVSIGYDIDKHSHGVKNHGSSFLKNLTLHQKGQITKLRKMDSILYNISRAVFDEQVRDMEANYDFKLCDQWNRPS